MALVVAPNRATALTGGTRMRKVALGLAVLLLAGGSGHLAAGGKNAVELDNLKSEAPASWKAGKADNKFRAYQFKLPKAAGDKEDAELIIFYFGPGGGGSADDNVKRWKSMIAPPPGKSADDISKVEKFKVGDVPVTYVDVHGTYLSKFPPFAPNAKVTAKENFRLIGVVFDSPKGGPYFLRLTGPQKTVEAHKKEFDNWLKAFK
jgi:hypothetical protein